MTNRKSTTKKKTGRRPIYTVEMADRVCEEIATGATLYGLGKQKGFPSEDTLYKWLREIDGFTEKYAHAKQRRADRFVEEYVETLRSPAYDPQEKRTRLDGLKWLAAKFAPREYGDKQEGPPTANITVALGDLSGQAKVIEHETVEPMKITKADQ